MATGNLDLYYRSQKKQIFSNAHFLSVHDFEFNTEDFGYYSKEKIGNFWKWMKHAKFVIVNNNSSNLFFWNVQLVKILFIKHFWSSLPQTFFRRICEVKSFILKGNYRWMRYQYFFRPEEKIIMQILIDFAQI